MSRLDAMLMPGEAVLWRRDRRVNAGPVWGYLVAAGFPLAIIAVIATVILWHVTVPVGVMVFGGLALLFPIFFIALAWADEWLPRAVAVTRGRILRAGSRRASREELARAEILRAELFEGSGTVDLHLAGGGIRTLNGIDDAEGFVRVLEVPARIWRQPPQPVAPLTVRLPRIAMFAVAIAGPKLTLSILEFATGGRLPGAFETTAFVLVTYVLCMAAVHGLFLASHRLAMRRLPPDEARSYRCWYLDRRCRGLRGHPETGGPPWVRLQRWYTGLIARQAFGGETDCDCAPEEIGPGGGSSA